MNASKDYFIPTTTCYIIIMYVDVKYDLFNTCSRILAGRFIVERVVNGPQPKWINESNLWTSNRFSISHYIVAIHLD